MAEKICISNYAGDNMTNNKNHIRHYDDTLAFAARDNVSCDRDFLTPSSTARVVHALPKSRKITK